MLDKYRRSCCQTKNASSYRNTSERTDMQTDSLTDTKMNGEIVKYFPIHSKNNSHIIFWATLSCILASYRALLEFFVRKENLKTSCQYRSLILLVVIRISSLVADLILFTGFLQSLRLIRYCQGYLARIEYVTPYNI